MAGSITVASYPAPVAIWQRVLALSRRETPQTRDAFDLDHLMRAASAADVERGRALVSGRMTLDQVGEACKTVSRFGQELFLGQTAMFLPDTHRQQAIDGWAATRDRVWYWLADTVECMRDIPEPRNEVPDAEE